MKSIKLLMISSLLATTSILYNFFHFYISQNRHDVQFNFEQILWIIITIKPISLFVFAYFIYKNRGESILIPSVTLSNKLKPILLFLITSTVVCCSTYIFSSYRSYNRYQAILNLLYVPDIIASIAQFMFFFALYKNKVDSTEIEKVIHLKYIKKTLIIVIFTSIVLFCLDQSIQFRFQQLFNNPSLEEIFRGILNLSGILMSISFIWFSKGFLNSINQLLIIPKQNKKSLSASKLSLLITSFYFLFAIIGGLLFINRFSGHGGSFFVFYLAAPLYLIVFLFAYRLEIEGIIIGIIVAFLVFYFLFYFIITLVRASKSKKKGDHSKQLKDEVLNNEYFHNEYVNDDKTSNDLIE